MNIKKRRRLRQLHALLGSTNAGEREAAWRKLDELLKALKAAGVTGMTVSEVQGFGRQAGVTEDLLDGQGAAGDVWGMLEDGGVPGQQGGRSEP